MTKRPLVFIAFIAVAYSQERVTVPFENPAGTTSNESYQGQVIVEVNGMGESFAQRLNDAFYIFTDNSHNLVTPYYGSPFYHLIINGLHPPLQGYNKDHRYRILFDAGEAPIQLNFRVSDINYSDNSGQYEITIYGNLPSDSAAIYPIANSIQTAGDEFWVDINIGTETQPVSSLFGINFALYYDGKYAEVVPPRSEHIILGDFLGDSSRVIFYSPTLPGDSIIIAITRKAGDTHASGQGTLARVKFRTSPDTPDSTRLCFAITSVTALDSAGKLIEVPPGDLCITILRKRVTVWPGDTNNDGIANGVDVLFVGLNWNSTGPARSNVSLDWVGQSALVWQPETATYADANGNSIVDEADIIPVGMNWGRTHETRGSLIASALSLPIAGEIGISFSPSSVRNEFIVDVVVSDVRDLFGVAYKLLYPKDKVRIHSVARGNIWSAEALFFFNDNNSTGVLGIGASLKDRGQALNAKGQIASIRIKTKPSVELTGDLQVALDDIWAVNRFGELVQLKNGTLTRADEPTTAPKEFRLYQNYPNPFNASTMIQFDLPFSTKVTIKIFDLVGVELKTLIEQERAAGSHHIIWDGTDARGQSVSTGVYLYKIIAGNLQETRKTVLMK